MQQYNSSTLAWGSPGIPDIGALNPQGITGIGSDLFFSSGTGVVIKYSGGISTTLSINPGGDNYLGITTDGTDLWMAQNGTGFAARYNTSGVLQSYFPAYYAAGIAYTTIPEPATWALLALGLTVVVTLRRRRAA